MLVIYIYEKGPLLLSTYVLCWRSVSCKSFAPYLADEAMILLQFFFFFKSAILFTSYWYCFSFYEPFVIYFTLFSERFSFYTNIDLVPHCNVGNYLSLLLPLLQLFCILPAKHSLHIFMSCFFPHNSYHWSHVQSVIKITGTCGT